MGGDTQKGSREVIFYCYVNSSKTLLKDTKSFKSPTCKRQSTKSKFSLTTKKSSAMGDKYTEIKPQFLDSLLKNSLTGWAQDFKYFLRKSLCPGICNRHYSYPLSTPKSGGWQTSGKFGICKKIKYSQKHVSK